MKAILVLLLAGGFWVAGYYCGQSPNSPRLPGWTSQKTSQSDGSNTTSGIAEAMRAGQREIVSFISNSMQEKPATPAQAKPEPVQKVSKAPSAAQAKTPESYAVPDCY